MYAVNKELILLYYHIGNEILKQVRNDYAARSVSQKLSNDLKSSFPEMKGFGTANLYNMRRFAELYQNSEGFQQLSGNSPYVFLITQKSFL